MHFKVQTIEGTRAIDVFKRALEDTAKICDHLVEKFPKSWFWFYYDKENIDFWFKKQHLMAFEW